MLQKVISISPVRSHYPHCLFSQISFIGLTINFVISHIMLWFSSGLASRLILRHKTCSSRAVHAASSHFSSGAKTHLLYPIRRFSADSSAPSIKLYQYHICPFCNITKSAMSYANLDYKVVEVNPLTKAELKPW